MSNKEKIIEAAKELFNLHGAANVGTNKIAAHLGISPGNLYYHFQNKEEIIRSIFPEIIRATENALIISGEDIPSEVRLAEILKNWMTVVWEYRFFYGNMVQLLRNDPKLQAQYVARRDATLAFLKAAFITAGVRNQRETPRLDDAGIDMLATNVWIIALNWIRYLQIGKADKDISKQDIAAGALQIFAILEPYLDSDIRQVMRGKLEIAEK